MSDIPELEPFTVEIPIVIRRAREQDLEALEWFGMFEPGMIRSIFQMQHRGDGVMLVVEANGAAAGQAWLDISRRTHDHVGVIWAVRIFPCLQGLGIGTRLIHGAEHVLQARGCKTAELTVECDNPAAKRLYQRLGYKLIGRAPANPQQWLLRKSLPRASPAAANGSKRNGRGAKAASH